MPEPNHVNPDDSPGHEARADAATAGNRDVSPSPRAEGQDDSAGSESHGGASDHVSHAPKDPKGFALAALSLTALGVVFGDIGTSPLYAIRECFHNTGGAHGHAITVTEPHVLGVLSLVFWSMTLVISIKYLVFVLRADHHGEGGILALAALASPDRKSHRSRRRRMVLILGLFGAALLYADGMITPAISVLSAIEGLEVVTSVDKEYVKYITIAILVGLFFIQSRGTAKVGAVFGPITLAWFISMAAIGIGHIIENPGVLVAINPYYAIKFFPHTGLPGFIILGTVFLVVTGGEALYADLGHFGIRPIRMGWFTIVMPCLLMNYFGQGAFLLEHAGSLEAAANPFFRMAPEWSVIPLVVLATSATVIASQAVITGAFSLTLQAVQFGYSPRMTIEHTSHSQAGQIYIPAVNWILMVACIGLVVMFGTSSNLAAAYGVAITITMVITTLLFYVLARDKWNWPAPLALGVCGVFLAIDMAFFAANITKLPDGGWFPLVVAGVAYLLMSTWMAGRQLLAKRLREREIALDLYVAELLSTPPRRVPGIAIFMSGNPVGTPPALRQNVLHNRVLHERVVILTVSTADVPRVAPKERVEFEEVGSGFYRVMLTYGFMDRPNVPRDLQLLNVAALPFEEKEVSYFLGRETLLATKRPGMAMWRERLFAFMARNAQRATLFYQIPPERVIEVGGQVEL